MHSIAKHDRQNIRNLELKFVWNVKSLIEQLSVTKRRVICVQLLQ